MPRPAARKSSKHSTSTPRGIARPSKQLVLQASRLQAGRLNHKGSQFSFVDERLAQFDFILAAWARTGLKCRNGADRAPIVDSISFAVFQAIRVDQPHEWHAS